MNRPDLSQASMLDLFRVEADDQAQVLTGGLLALERDPTASQHLESCMRSAHSLKGAARIVDVAVGVSVAHAMESCFVAAQQGRIILDQHRIDELLRGVDLIRRIAQTPEPQLGQWDTERAIEVDARVAALNRLVETTDTLIDEATGSSAAAGAPQLEAVLAAAVQDEESGTGGPATHDRVLRVTAEHLNRLLGLAGESLVESRWVMPFAQSLLRLKRMHYDLYRALDHLFETLPNEPANADAEAGLKAARQRALECRQFMSQRLDELELFDRRTVNLAHRLYESALACRMRPFADGTRGYPRMVRDLARILGKQVKLQVVGDTTLVDRDVLERLDAPIGHLLRNAVDHGIEPPQERRALGKPIEGTLRLEARHSAGRLVVVVSDDGRGIDVTELRAAVVRRNLANADMAARMSDTELFEFLLLPGFSLAHSVTNISGRGVGLDAVQDMLKQVRGTLRITSQQGKGAQFQLHLPLTLSVVRALLVEVGGEPYAIPLARIVRTLRIPRGGIQSLEGKPHFDLDGRRVGLVSAHQILEGPPPKAIQGELSVVVLGSEGRTFGLLVDGLLGERELVVQPLDSRLGKIQDISVGSLMEDGSPVLIVDIDDIIRSVEKLTAAGTLDSFAHNTESDSSAQRKRVLVVDDSLTVRELERKLLVNGGYEVEVAVDGMDGWNAVRTGKFDLLVTDIDMPRMDGIELVTLVKQDPHVKSLPVMIVSYKDRPEDRQRGLQAGADYYLAKGSFHDRALLNAVADLIGAPGS
jgi:two-component system, chemotaxis family, sensor histidine kinase and response regulator WspE